MPTAIPLRLIHCAVAAAPPDAMEEHDESSRPVNGKLKPKAEDETHVSLFHQTLHEYILFARPKTIKDITDLCVLVNRLVPIMGQSADAWKIFTLTGFLRRYHRKSPESKATPTEEDFVGDGERLVFYVTLLALYHYWHNSEREDTAGLAKEAVLCMIRIADRVGGSRDLNAIVEHLTMASLVQNGFMGFDSDPPATFADKFVPAVQQLLFGGQVDEALLLALRLVAQQLEQDQKIVSSSLVGNTYEDLISTIHVTIPHRQRGTNTKGGWQRKLANSVAEILIWQKTPMHKRFAASLQKLKTLPIHAVDEAHALLQTMQTSIRRERQKLNKYARKQGFLLTSSYQIDKSSLNLHMIRRAKAGDLGMLTKLARKNGDASVLRMVAKRNLDPDKSTPLENIQDLANDWVDMHQKYDADDEITPLEICVQRNTVEATIKKLRRATERTVFVTCVGSDKDNLLAAILVAASLEKSQLWLKDVIDVSSTDKCLNVLNDVLVHSKHTAEAGSMNAEDFLTNVLWDSSDAVIFSQGDLLLDEAILKRLQERDITARVHSTKKIHSAPVGEMQCHLNDTVYNRIKAKDPFTLGVILDCTGSMGGEIEGCKSGALKLISSFQRLAPVSAVNFMGYWDPVNVGSDPHPKSTGYVDAMDPSSLNIVQDFVHTELVCQGGGDEPEDIPEALEVYIEDMKKAGLGADKGVHMLIFITDAGYRSHEKPRVEAALKFLRELGVIFVMCAARPGGYYGGTLPDMVSSVSEVFEAEGQHIAISGEGQLEMVASSVTESIQASLFGSSSIVSVTASVGGTIDALGKLSIFQEDHGVMKKTEELTSTEDGEGKVRVLAKKKEYALTSRDHLYLQLSRLPALCHDSVNSAFGGKSLLELSAAAIADRLREEDIPVAEVSEAGYPEEIVAMVQNLMGGYGAMRLDEEVA